MDFVIARLLHDPEQGKLTRRQPALTSARMVVGSTVASTVAARVAVPVVQTVPDPDDWDLQLSHQTIVHKF
ncbi:MAG TPA: hypothetical protein VIP11_21910 [Gemmatimonadaceae bacterium]